MLIISGKSRVVSVPKNRAIKKYMRRSGVKFRAL
jgi:hypothetical protein